MKKDYFTYSLDGGMVLYVKRLEEGTFRLPAYDSRSRSYPMEWRDLVMMVEGISDNLKTLTDPSNNLIFQAHIYFDSWHTPTASSTGLPPLDCATSLYMVRGDAQTCRQRSLRALYRKDGR